MGRDVMHRRCGSNAVASGPISPVASGQFHSASFLAALEPAEKPGSSSGSELDHGPSLSGKFTGAPLLPAPQVSVPGSRSPPQLQAGTPAFGDKAGGSPNLAGAPAPPVWRKVLYEKQPFEDNYVDAAFMEQLRTNTHLRALKYRDILRSTMAILQQLNLVVLFLVVYAATLQGVLTPANLVFADIALLGVALVCYVALTDGTFGVRTLFEPAKKTAVVTGVLVLLGPMFHTLTRSYTDDTIWALSILLGFIHVVFADYDYLNANTADYTHNLSMNAAIVGVALLGSRVENPVASAALIGIGILVFTLSPILRHHIRRASVDAHESSALILCGIVIGCLVQLNPLIAAVFVVAVLILTVAVPLFFVRVQSNKYKTQIQGPWDEAKPQNSAAAAEWANAGLLS